MMRNTQLPTETSRRGKAFSVVARFRSSRRVTFVEIIAGVVAIATVCVLVGSAAVPTDPNNIIVFPDRDFVSVQGYEGVNGVDIGKTALLEVSRTTAGVTTVIGSAQAVIAAGGIAFEVNHPGGVCWGNGTTLKVTPDIIPFDVVSLKILDGALVNPVGETTVGDAFVTQDATVNGSTLTVTGHIGDSVGGPADGRFIEQRIVSPDLLDTPVARRSIAAIQGPPTVDAGGAYSSGMTVDTVTNTFTATYVFLNADPAVNVATAKVAASSFLGERAMSWQVVDAAGNRQGLTIAEFGEPGGPGMGGCPGGPSQLGSPTPGSAFVVRSAEAAPATTDQLKVDWVPVTAAPGADPVTGYSIEAIASTANAAGEHVQSGTRVGMGATQTMIHGLAAGETYTVEVRSASTAPDGSTKLSAAFPVSVPASGDITAPLLTATPAPGTLAIPAPTNTGVTLKATDPLAQNPAASDPNADIYYTTDGSAVLDAGGLPNQAPTGTARLYAGAIPITGPTEINAVAFDAAGNHSILISGFYTLGAADPVPQAPTALTATAGSASVTLGWSKAVVDPTITGYDVQLYKDLVTDGALRPATATTMTISSLTVGASYTFQVMAKNPAGSSLPSVMSAAAVPTAITDQVTITSAKWKPKDFRVIGTGSAIGATVTIRIGTAGCAAPLGTVIGTGPVVAAVLPATGGAFDIRFKDNLVVGATRPATICAFSNQGGIAGPFATTLG